MSTNYGFEPTLDGLNNVDADSSTTTNIICDTITVRVISKHDLDTQKNLIGLSPNKNILFKGWIVSDRFTYLYKEVDSDSQDP